MITTTLCYIEKDGKYLMLHRVKKHNDINEGKWIGVGGHAENQETPEECLVREVKEETGLMLTSYRFRGLVTFISNECEPELMCVFTADGFTGELIECDEGELAWVDKEVIACPVVEGNEVHVASQRGVYYVFDKVSGKNIHTSKTWKALTSPTLTSDFIYITANIDGKEQLMVLDRKTLKTVKKYPQIFLIDPISAKSSCYDQMNYNGAHPIIYKNELIILLDKTRLMVFDAQSERMLWEKKVEAHSNQTPLVVNGKVLVAAKDGGIWTFDLKSGTPVLNEKVESEIDGQPIGYKDFMFIASAGILKMIQLLENTITIS